MPAAPAPAAAANGARAGLRAVFTRGVQLQDAAALKALAAEHKAIQDVRGLGAMVAIELFKDGDVSQPDAELTKRVCAEGLKRGLVLLSCGVYANVIRILVPLTASDALLDEGLAILGQAFEAAQA